MPDKISQQARVLPETDLPASTSKLTSNDSSCPVPSTSSASSGSQEQPDSDAMPSGQPSLALLASFGIKVRDFAYESTLPPIASVPRVPRQVLPGPRPLKRARREYDGSEEEPSPTPPPPRSQGGRSVSDSRYTDAPRKTKLLERKSTEPAPDPSIPLSARARAYTDLSGYDPLENMSLPLRTLSIQVPTLPSQSQLNDDSNQPTSPSGSQEIEPYVHTPSVTPNGSLQWALPPCPPSDDELPAPDDSSPSPRIDATDHNQANEPPPSSSPRIASSSPLKSQTSLLLSPPSIGLLKSTATPPVAQRTLQTPQLDTENNRPEASSTEPPTTTSPRYVLRKRPAASPQASPRPPSRARSSRTTVLRQPHFSMQAAHSASKSPIGGSPRTRTLRKIGKEASATHSS